jgi:hypothetical protein
MTVNVHTKQTAVLTDIIFKANFCRQRFRTLCCVLKQVEYKVQSVVKELFH